MRLNLSLSGLRAHSFLSLLMFMFRAASDQIYHLTIDDSEDRKSIGIRNTNVTI